MVFELSQTNIKLFKGISKPILICNIITDKLSADYELGLPSTTL